MTTVAHWTVLPLAEKACAKNVSSLGAEPFPTFALTSGAALQVILFVGDGMTSSMATAARMLGHKSINVSWAALHSCGS